MSYPPTFKDMQNDVIDKLRLDADLDTGRVQSWINSAYMEACAATEFYVDSIATSTLPTNAGSTGVPAPLLTIDYIVSKQSDGTNYGVMDLVPLDEILSRRSYGGSTSPTQGAPQMYAYRSGPSPTIEFWPGASGGELLTFYGSRLPPVLSGDGDVCLIPEPYGSNLLVMGAAVQAAEWKMNYIMLSTYQQESAVWMQQFRGFQNNRVGNQTPQLQIVHARKPVAANNSVDLGY